MGALHFLISVCFPLEADLDPEPVFGLTKFRRRTPCPAIMTNSCL